MIHENPVRGNEAPFVGNELTHDSTNTDASLEVSTSWHNTRRMIYVRSNPRVAIGHWPIPEAFWPDPGAQSMVC